MMTKMESVYVVGEDEEEGAPLAALLWVAEDDDDVQDEQPITSTWRRR